MAEPKTRPNNKSVKQFLTGIEHEQRRKDGLAMLDIMSKLSGMEARMWGDSLIGFGSYHYKYASGREGDWFLTGFSPRKQNLTLYIMDGFEEYEALMQQLGKHKTGKSCLYINKLEDIDLKVLKKIIKLSIKHVKHSSL